VQWVVTKDLVGSRRSITKEVRVLEVRKRGEEGPGKDGKRRGGSGGSRSMRTLVRTTPARRIRRTRAEGGLLGSHRGNPLRLGP